MKPWAPPPLSLRQKIPLRSALLVFITATVVTVSLLVREYAQLRSDIFESARRWNDVLAQTLVAPLRHDDLWRSYEIMRAATGNSETQELPAVITLVDPKRMVYVSTAPERFPVMTPLHELGASPRELDALLQQDPLRPHTRETIDGRLLILSPIQSNGILLGHLMFEYSTSLLATRFLNLWWSASAVTALVLLLIVPLSAYWGRRVADPLIGLAQCMGHLRERLPSLDECPLPRSQDEIGQLAEAFRQLLGELRHKQELEQQVRFSERLAAIGRLTAGIAHEVNNPLGGMLNAISTYRRHGGHDPALTERTISLLERGLLQIRDTVSALLVEAKAPSHPLGPRDFEDVRTLIQPDLHAKQTHLQWHCELPGEIDLPATLVRQVMINLLLNAVHALARHGNLSCTSLLDEKGLQLLVENDGDHIPEEDLPFLFEPFVGQGRHGLGLWITYQIVTELNGTIHVRSEPGWTAFAVHFPLPVPSPTEPVPGAPSA